MEGHCIDRRKSDVLTKDQEVRRTPNVSPTRISARFDLGNGREECLLATKSAPEQPAPSCGPLLNSRRSSTYLPMSEDSPAGACQTPGVRDDERRPTPTARRPPTTGQRSPECVRGQKLATHSAVCEHCRMPLTRAGNDDAMCPECSENQALTAANDLCTVVMSALKQTFEAKCEKMGSACPLSPLHQLAISNSLSSSLASKQMADIVKPAYRSTVDEEPTNSHSRGQKPSHASTKPAAEDALERGAPTSLMACFFGKFANLFSSTSTSRSQRTPEVELRLEQTTA